MYCYYVLILTVRITIVVFIYYDMIFADTCCYLPPLCRTQLLVGSSLWIQPSSPSHLRRPDIQPLNMFLLETKELSGFHIYKYYIYGISLVWYILHHTASYCIVLHHTASSFLEAEYGQSPCSTWQALSLFPCCAGRFVTRDVVLSSVDARQIQDDSCGTYQWLVTVSN